MLFKMSEWESATGKWRCACVDNLSGGSSAWWLPARILGISPADYVSLVINEYKPDDVWVLGRDSENPAFIFSWNNQTKMRLYKNFINRKAREVNFQI